MCTLPRPPWSAVEREIQELSHRSPDVEMLKEMALFSRYLT